MTPEELRRRQILSMFHRNDRARFNEPAMPDAGPLAARIAAAKQGDYQRFGAGGNGVVLNQMPAQADPLADTPQDVARKAAMSQLKLKGTPGGVSEVSGPPGDIRGALQGAMVLNAVRRKNSRNGAGQTQMEAARTARDQMAQRALEMSKLENPTYQQQALIANRGRPSPTSNNMGRRDRRIADIREFNAVQAEQQIALAKALHGSDPSKQAMANYHNAMADAIRRQMAQEAEPAAGGPPGAPPAPQPGAPLWDGSTPRQFSNDGLERGVRIRRRGGRTREEMLPVLGAPGF